ncbi:centlein [Strongylocentrotus purpuratus]|uniref:Centlein n=1 Tax=Strongylocentrotus purpuratus TaxID=7668 RepID=A0A7M7N8M5_STRPU|nr:centlein [Strongylocentrotus purpuratus]
MATSHSDDEVQRLGARNQALSEELAQCQADKEFVWSLWKRVQVANPDISQAISMVVQREKEKAELKDRKVLEILHSKDDRIAELEQLVSKQERRLVEVAERVGDASFNRREELTAVHIQHEQQTKDTKQKEKEQAHRMQTLLDEKDKALTELNAEKEELEHRVAELQSTVEESQAALAKMQELNGEYKAKVQELQHGLEDVVQKARLASDELDSKNEGLQRAKARLQELTKEMMDSGHDLHRTRLEYEDLKAQHEQTLHQAAQQAQLIHQLQALQADTHKVLKNQESAHSLDSTNFQKMYHELRIKFEKLVHSEKELKQRLAEAEGQVTTKRPMRSVSLQVNLKESSGQRSRSRTRSRSQEVLRMEQREEWTTIAGTHQRGSYESSSSPDQHTRADRATSTPTKHAARRARSLSPSGSRRDSHHQEPDGAWSQGRISDFLDASERQRGGGRDARKKEDLRKLLRLKNQEVEELRKAHGRRLERLRTLQSAYDVVKEQIKTYEQHESGKEKKKKRLPRSESKDLRREDSDGVWNDLAYYKQQTTNLMQEKMNIEEEIDRLRVQATVDASTIEDLTRCLEDEKNGLESHLARLQAANKREEREKARAEDLFDKNTRLHNSLHSLQNTQSEWAEERDRLERQLRSMRADLVQANTASTRKEVEHQALVEEITKLKTRMKRLATTMRREADRERQTPQIGDEDRGPGVHVIVHKEDGDDDDDDDSQTDGEADGEDDGDHQDRDFYHSTPLKSSARRSRSLSPAKNLFGSPPRPRSRSRTSSQHSTRLDGSTRTSMSHHSSRSRSLGASGISPSRRELMAVLHHLDRMAHAYQDIPPVFQTLLMSVATQTERVAIAESGIMTETEGSDSGSTLSTEGAIFPGIQPISPISSRRDTATSPIKSLSISSQTGSKKAASRTRGSSPGPVGVNVLKTRLGALQQQVASLQEQRRMLQKAAVEYKETNDALQSDLNLANGRHQNSKITIQRLTHDLGEARKEKDLLQVENQELTKQRTDKHSDSEWKSSEARLKYQASEIVRQGSVIKAMKTEKETLHETIKSLESKIQHLDRDLSQKRSLIDDLRGRARSAGTSDKMHAETVGSLIGWQQNVAFSYSTTRFNLL